MRNLDIRGRRSSDVVCQFSEIAKTVLCGIFLVLPILDFRSAAAQSFSCPIGKQAACFDYTDEVCDGLFSKCVKRDAKCFDKYTCGIGGEFACKSDVEKAVSDQNHCVDKYNTLLRDFDDLQHSVSQVKRDNQELNSNLTTLRNNRDDLQQKYDQLQKWKTGLESCISSAATLEDAQHCD